MTIACAIDLVMKVPNKEVSIRQIFTWNLSPFYFYFNFSSILLFKLYLYLNNNSESSYDSEYATIEAEVRMRLSQESN